MALAALGALTVVGASCKGPQEAGAGGSSGSPLAPGTPAPTATPPSLEEVTALYTGPDSVAPYVATFLRDAESQGVNVLADMDDPKLEIQLGNLDSYGSSVIGLCETGSIRRVTFDPDFWDTVSEEQREVLSHHELGHCVLLRGHRSTLLTSGAYASIMYPSILGSGTYTANRDYYINELFTFGAVRAAALASAPVVPDDATGSGEPASPSANGEPRVHICDVSEVFGTAAGTPPPGVSASPQQDSGENAAENAGENAGESSGENFEGGVR